MKSLTNDLCSFCAADQRAVGPLYPSRIAESRICHRCIREMSLSLSPDSGRIDQLRANYKAWSWAIAVFPLALLIWFGIIFSGPSSRSDVAQVLVGLYVVVYTTFEAGKRLVHAPFDGNRI